MATKNNPANERRALRRRRRLRQLLGAAVCVLVVIGLFSVVSGGVRATAKLFDDTDEMRMYEERLSTLVALDPLPFGSLTEADTPTLLTAIIWGTISTVNRDTLERDEVGAMYLPTVDLDKTAQALYGPDFKFNYATFTSRDLTYNYVPEKEAYLVPITSAITDYYPRVEKIQRKSGEQRVTVGYLATYSEGGTFNPNATPTPVKYNDYVFVKNKTDGNYYLTAIVASEMKVEAATSGSDLVEVMPEEVLQDVMPSTSADSASAADSGAASDSTLMLTGEPEAASTEGDAASSSSAASSTSGA